MNVTASLDSLLPKDLHGEPVEARRRGRLVIYAIVLINLAAIAVLPILLLMDDGRSFWEVALWLLPHPASFLVFRLTRSTRATGHYLLAAILMQVIWAFELNRPIALVALIGIPIIAAHIISIRACLAWTSIGLGWVGYVALVERPEEPLVMGFLSATMIVSVAICIASTVIESTRSEAQIEMDAAERYLARQIDRIRTFVETAFPVLVEIEHEAVIYASPGIARLLGRPEDEDLGFDLERFLHPDDVERLSKGVIANAPEGFRDEIRVRHADGRWRWLEVFGIPATETRWIFGARDITEEQESRDRLQQAQRLEGVGVLAAGMAHDFNNLLTVIIGFTELMPESTQRTEVLAASREAAELTAQLLAFARAGPQTTTIVDLNAFFERVRPMFQSLCRESIELEIRSASEPLPVRINAAQLSQVMLNLVTNAKEAMSDGGSLTITLERLPSDHRGRINGPIVRCVLRDTGIGMAPETIEHAFDPFFSTKSPNLGFGLGLSSSYGIITKAGGRIELKSEGSGGSEVEIVLPVSDERPNEETPTSRELLETKPIDTRQADILVLEDDPTIRDMISTVLTRNGRNVRTAASGFDALELVRDQHPAMIISDIVMPGMRGTEFVKRVRAVAPKVPILLISGYSDSAYADLELSKDSVRFLAKPFRTRELLDHVEGMTAS